MSRPDLPLYLAPDELMTLCDQLETQLNTTETDSRRLLEAVLHEALSPALVELA